MNSLEVNCEPWSECNVSQSLHGLCFDNACFIVFMEGSLVIFFPLRLATTEQSYKSIIVQLYLLLPFDKKRYVKYVHHTLFCSKTSSNCLFSLFSKILYSFYFSMYPPDLISEWLFSGFSVIVISVGRYAHSFQKPSYAKHFVILVDKLVCLQSISFAKNAAAFFKNSFSFLDYSSSLRSLFISFIWSLSSFLSAFLWHSSLYALSQFWILALLMWYSSDRLINVLPSSRWSLTIISLKLLLYLFIILVLSAGFQVFGT